MQRRRFLAALAGVAILPRLRPFLAPAFKGPTTLTLAPSLSGLSVGDSIAWVRGPLVTNAIGTITAIEKSTITVEWKP